MAASWPATSTALLFDQPPPLLGLYAHRVPELDSDARCILLHTCRGCLDSEEVARWQQAVPGLSCNVVRELRCEGGTFTARLSNKSAARLG